MTRASFAVSLTNEGAENSFRRLLKRSLIAYFEKLTKKAIVCGSRWIPFLAKSVMRRAKCTLIKLLPRSPDLN